MSGGMAELTEIDVDVEALVRDARAGDRHALGQLYDTYRDRVARFATGRLGDPEKAEDVTSETFEAVCRNLGSYRAAPISRPGCSPSPTGGWPTTSGAGTAARRSRWTRPYRPAGPATPGPGPSRAWPGSRRPCWPPSGGPRWPGAFRGLRPDQQEVLALRVLGGLSAAQVGEVLGKSGARCGSPSTGRSSPCGRRWG